MLRSLPWLIVTVVVGVPLPAFCASEPWAPTGDVLVRFEREPSIAELARLRASSGGVDWERARGAWPVFRLELPDGADPARLSSQLRGRSDVRWAEPDRHALLQAHGPVLDDPYLADQWHLENLGQNTAYGLPGADVGARQAWHYVDGSGQLIAIMDSGVDIDHPDLDALPTGLNVEDGSDDPRPYVELENHNHGTAVAGLAAATGGNGIGVAGVAYGARILAVRLLGEVTLFGIYNGFVFATEEGASVLNNSWGMSQPDCPDVPVYDMLQDAMAYPAAEGRGGLGAVVLFSTGNHGCDASAYPMLLVENVIGVGAINDRDRLLDYSNTGDIVDVVAPSGSGYGAEQGLTLSTTDHSTAGWDNFDDEGLYTNTMSGTSASCPVAAGVVALMLDANPRLTERQVREVLCATAVRVDLEGGDYDAAGWSPRYGCGRVHAGAAVEAVLDAGPPEAPIWISTGGEQIQGLVGLRWQGVDPDGDEVVWTLRLTSAADESDVREWQPAGAAWQDQDPLPVGSRWTAVVVGADEWGPGLESEPLAFSVVAAPDPEPEDGAACSATVAPGGGGLLLGLAGLAGRRRRGWARRGDLRSVLVMEEPVTGCLGGGRGATDRWPATGPQQLLRRAW
jgi:subtilisin family serine protease